MLDYGVPEVVVLGDIMLDRYTDVDIKSAAVESNALIVRDRVSRSVLGGAANVAANVAGLGRRVQLFGVVGTDDVGREVTAHLGRQEINWEPTVWETPGHYTPVRHRIVSPHGQLLRIDRDSVLPLRRVILANDDDPLHRFEREFYEVLNSGDAENAKTALKVIVVSDYTHGYCDPAVIWPALLMASRCGYPLLVDPPRDGAWYNYVTGTTIFKPNVRQAANFLKALYPGADYRFKYKDLGMPETGYISGTRDRGHAVACCTQLFDAVRSELLDREMPFMYLWLTMGQDGALVGPADRSPPLHLPGHPVEVADVTGAGDTAMAVLAAHLATVKKYDWGTFIEGVTRANIGAAVAVSHRGTYRLTAHALRCAMNKMGGTHGEEVVAKTAADPQQVGEG